MCLHPKQPIVALVCHNREMTPCAWHSCCCLLASVLSGKYPHLNLNLLLQSVANMVAEYDLLSGCKLGSTEAGGTPISLQYTSDAALLVAVLKVHKIGN